MINNELQAETAADSSTTDAILPSALLAQNPMLAVVVGYLKRFFTLKNKNYEFSEN